jgi:hypothetical protein
VSLDEEGTSLSRIEIALPACWNRYILLVVPISHHIIFGERPPLVFRWHTNDHRRSKKYVGILSPPSAGQMDKSCDFKLALNRLKYGTVYERDVSHPYSRVYKASFNTSSLTSHTPKPVPLVVTKRFTGSKPTLCRSPTSSE